MRRGDLHSGGEELLDSQVVQVAADALALGERGDPAHLGAQIVAGTADPLAVSAGYARVAEAAVEVLAAAAVIVPIAFRDQSLASVAEAIQIRLEVGPAAPWTQDRSSAGSARRTSSGWARRSARPAARSRRGGATPRAPA